MAAAITISKRNRIVNALGKVNFFFSLADCDETPVAIVFFSFVLEYSRLPYGRIDMSLELKQIIPFNGYEYSSSIF